MLTSDQIQEFNRQGYLVVPNVIPHATLDAVRVEYAALMGDLYAAWFAEGRVETPPEQLDFWGKLLSAYQAKCDWFQPMDISLPNERITPETPFHFGPAVFDLLTCAPLLDIAEALLGPEVASNPIQHVRLKPPATHLQQDEVRAHITATDWHQDRAVGLEESDETDMLTVWIAVTDATLDNGCLQVIPKASDQSTLPHCPKTQTAIADGFIDEARAVPLPVGAGGVVLFHPLTPHASRINHTDGFRWSFDIRFNVTGQPTGRSHFPSFVARSRARPATELRDWRAWKTMWEETREHLSTGAHIEQHRWASDSPFCA